MNRYYVKLKNSLKEKSIAFYIRAYNRTQIVDMFGEEYIVYSIEVENV